MAGKNTISITFKLDGDGKGFRDLAKDAEGFKRVITSTISEAQQLKGNVINFAALATGLDATQRSFSQLQSGMRDLADTYAVQETAERKLGTVMAQRMNATDAEIQSIKDLASAQQEIGVIGDEVQLSGAQQIATFLTQKQSLEALLPTMNNLLAQQKGLNATTQDAVSVGNLMGKVMQGQTSALTRVGITFSEAEEKVLKYGTEQERAAMLAQVITNNVGNMNAELAQTDSGRQQQVVNTLGDMKEQLGALVSGALPFVTMTAHATTFLTSITTLIGGVKALTLTLYSSIKAFTASSIALVRNKGAVLAVAAAQKISAAATAAWAGVQKILNLVLTMNPIGLVIAAVGALVTVLISAYNNCEGFRAIVDKVWEAIKPLANAIMNGLAKAFEWLVEKCKEAWEWLKNILGLGGKKVEVSVEVSKSKSAPGLNLGELTDKYKDYNASPSNKGGKSTNDTTKSVPELNENASVLKEITGNIEYLRSQLENATVEEATLINQQIAKWEEKADAIREAGLAVEESGAKWHENAKNLQEVTDNISILDEKLKTATIEEAALINRQKDAFEAQADAFRNAGKAVADTSPKWDDNASSLKSINDNISILNTQLENATIEEATLINQQIRFWREKADAIRNAGNETKNTFGRLKAGYKSVNDVAAGLDGITSSLEGNGSAWQKLTGIVNGFIQISEGVKAIVDIVKMLSNVTATHTAVKTAEAVAIGASTGAQTAETVAAEVAAGAQAPVIAANKLATASYMELAAAAYFAAHAYIPFAGFGIAAGFVSASAAMVKAIGATMLIPFAEGGIISGPTIGLMGEYAGAANNPEVVAPLDKLRAMIEPSGNLSGTVEFKIKERELYGILQKGNTLRSRS